MKKEIKTKRDLTRAFMEKDILSKSIEEMKKYIEVKNNAKLVKRRNPQNKEEVEVHDIAELRDWYWETFYAELKAEKDKEKKEKARERAKNKTVKTIEEKIAEEIEKRMKKGLN